MFRCDWHNIPSKYQCSLEICFDTSLDIKLSISYLVLVKELLSPLKYSSVKKGIFDRKERTMFWEQNQESVLLSLLRNSFLFSSACIMLHSKDSSKVLILLCEVFGTNHVFFNSQPGKEQSKNTLDTFFRTQELFWKKMMIEWTAHLFLVCCHKRMAHIFCSSIYPGNIYLSDKYRKRCFWYLSRIFGIFVFWTVLTIVAKSGTWTSWIYCPCCRNEGEGVKYQMTGSRTLFWLPWVGKDRKMGSNDEIYFSLSNSDSSTFDLSFWFYFRRSWNVIQAPLFIFCSFRFYVLKSGSKEKSTKMKCSSFRMHFEIHKYIYIFRKWTQVQSSSCFEFFLLFFFSTK